LDPNRIYASRSSGWFGQIIQRTDDGGQDWSHEPVDAPLPAAVASGAEPFMIVGAMAGG